VIVASLLLHGSKLHTLTMCTLLTLLRNDRHTRQTKLELCRVLLRTVHQHDPTAAVSDNDNDDDDNNNNNFRPLCFFLHLIESVIQFNDHESCEILFQVLFQEAGSDDGSTLDPWYVMYFAMSFETPLPLLCKWLVREYQADPFLVKYHQQDDDDHDEICSPFLMAARTGKMDILDDFLDLWDEQFEWDRYRNSNGDKPEEILMRDPHVSVQTFQHVTERYYFEDKVAQLTRDFADAHVGGDDDDD
jgi:hypothetical protein